MSTKKLRNIKYHLLVCDGKSCRESGSDKVAKRIKETVKDIEKQNEVLMTRTSCTDQCSKGPIVIVYPEGVWYCEVTPKIAAQIVSKHVSDEEVLERKVLVQLTENQ